MTPFKRSIFKKSLTNKKVFNAWLFIVAILLFFAVFYKSITASFAHGITWHVLIPFISGYIIWINRKEYSFNTNKPSPILGSLLLLIAYFMIFCGTAASTLVITELAIVVGIWGIVIFFGGTTLFIKLLWPLAYLLFISSFTEGLFDLFTPSFRYLSASLATYMAKIAGYSILLSETYIRLPYMVLNVADECSGVNHLISLFAIALPFAFLTQRKYWKVAFLTISAIPIALLSNSIRVLILIIYNYNQHFFSHGPNNLFITGFGFFIGIVLLFLVTLLLSRIPEKSFPSQVIKSPHSLNDRFIFTVSSRTILIFVAVLLIGVIIPLIWKIQDPSVGPDFTKIKNSMAGWTSEQVDFTPGLRNLPITDENICLKFTNNHNQALYLYIGWYSKQIQGREVVGDIYDRHFKQTGTLTFNLHRNKTCKFHLCQTKPTPGNHSYLVMYRSFNNYTSNPLLVKLYTIKDAFVHRTTSASIIIIAFPDHVTNNCILPDYLQSYINTLFSVIDSPFITIQ